MMMILKPDVVQFGILFAQNFVPLSNSNDKVQLFSAKKKKVISFWVVRNFSIAFVQQCNFCSSTFGVLTFKQVQNLKDLFYWAVLLRPTLNKIKPFATSCCKYGTI